MAETVSADYLIVGAGGMGMAFIDTLLSETKASIAIVDRYHRPGGHWTTAYPFVRLHQPSAFYGVNSKHLGQDKIDQIGWNKGLYELATSDEVCAYYSQVMNETFLPSGRVAYYPKHDYEGDGEFRSLVTGKTFRVGKNTRIVDATYMRVTVPSMRPPPYDVAHNVTVVTPNNLTKISRPYANYTVVGAGKTGIDTCLWLLSMNLEPSQITWIMPRDSWYMNRGTLQPGGAFAETRHSRVDETNQAVMAATSVEDLFKQLEACGTLLRLTDQVWPTMFRCATVSTAELEQIRRIKTVVRKGRVQRISADEVTLDGGKHTAVPDTIYIDCSADGLAKEEAVPVFSGNRITLQPVRYCQQVFSAAFISHVEAAYDDEGLKNDLCRPVPHPDDAIDWLIITLLTRRNALRWNTEPKTAAWLKLARLNWFDIFVPALPENPEQQRKAAQTFVAQIIALCEKLEKLLGTLTGKEGESAMAQITRA